MSLAWVTLDSILESAELSINTNNFTREEIQQSNRQMQQESERKWGN